MSVCKLLYPLGQITRLGLRDKAGGLNTVNNQLKLTLRKQACFQPVALGSSVIENFQSRCGCVQLMNIPIDRANV